MPRRWARNRPVIATSQEVVTAEACACGGRQDCTRAAEDRFRAWNAGKHRCDEALAQPFRPTYRLLTGLVANVSDPLAYQGLLLELNSQMGIIIQDQLAMAELGAMLWVHVEVARPYGLAGELPPLQVEQLPDPLACPLTGPYKVSLDLETVGISFNCEKIGVALSKGLRFFDLFAELELEYSGKVTEFAGAKVDVGAGGLSAAGAAKSGLYFSATREGVGDVGAKVSASHVAAAVPVGPLPFGIALERESESSVSFVPF
jgi:hypothetical protein